LNVSTGIWVATFVFFVGLFVLDLVVVRRNPRIPTTRECLAWLGLYVGIAVAFGIALGIWGGPHRSAEFFAGWITEYSLSVDNLFVFILIMGRFFVPRALQQSALLWGIGIALVLRGVFIALGAAAIEHYTWVFYIFGFFLVFTAVKLATEGESEDDEYRENALIRWVARHITMTTEFAGTSISYIENGRRTWTPMLIVLLALGTTDLLFAIDSIPAIFGLTDQAYIVFATNVFALLGLRQLYFLLGAALDRLIYLSIGLSVVLGFIGVSLVLEALAANTVSFINSGAPVNVPVPTTGLSLGFIVATLVVTAVASLARSRALERANQQEAPGA